MRSAAELELASPDLQVSSFPLGPGHVMEEDGISKTITRDKDPHVSTSVWFCWFVLEVSTLFEACQTWLPVLSVVLFPLALQFGPVD